MKKIPIFLLLSIQSLPFTFSFQSTTIAPPRSRVSYKTCHDGFLLANHHYSPSWWGCVKSSSSLQSLENTIPKSIRLFSTKNEREVESTSTSHHHQQQQEKETEEILSILHKYKYASNLVTLSTTSSSSSSSFSLPPTLAEMYANNKYQLCLLLNFRPPSLKQLEKNMPPLVEVLPLSSSLEENEEEKDDLKNVKSMVVDMGQITNIWTCETTPLPSHLTAAADNDVSLEELQLYFQSLLQKAKKSMQHFPITHFETCMQKLYNAHSHSSSHYSSSSTSLNKKQIQKIASTTQNPNKIQEILRKIVKSSTSLVDSLLALEYIYNDYTSNDYEKLMRRIVGAELLGQDAELGGRFKRLGCIFISARYIWKEGEIVGVESVTVWNGGWIAVNSSVRAGAEARKFAERSVVVVDINNDSKKGGTEEEKEKILTTTTTTMLKTEADERIARRLECLAMGEVFTSNNKNDVEQQQQQQNLELDVRETLNAMKLPTSPEGAKQALVRIGRWSENQTKTTKRGGGDSSSAMMMVEPWSQDTLNAAKKLVQQQEMDRKKLYQQSILGGGGNGKKEALEQRRIDVTSLPCICIDAKRTSFRDDAIGVRPRSSTGRRVVKDASKWEILIHIADVSEIYSSSSLDEKKDEFLDSIPLRKAAESRGMSRYDLPLGPLHLMPPVALEALALVTESPSSSSLSSSPQDVKCVNKCVTLWAYIDERNGKLLDAGLERTLISPPLALTFQSASTLLERDNADTTTIEPIMMKKAKAVLSVAERNLSLWSQYHRQTNEAARKREERLAVKEFISNKVMKNPNDRDDGVGGSFQRTRGHRIVDSSLDLYGYALTGLIKRKKQPIPRASGSGAASRGGRLGTAPLRRYIDGIAQRQALAVLCGYGGPPMTRVECAEANRIADKATNAMSNIKSVKNKGIGESSSGVVVAAGTTTTTTSQGKNRYKALLNLSTHLARRSDNGNDKNVVPAISTGRANEVAILGIGVTAKCAGVKGTLKSGERVLVEVTKLDPERGILKMRLYQNKGVNI